MREEISIFIKNKKAYYGRDSEYNTVIIDRNRITETEYRNEIIKRIIRLVETKPTEYKLPKEKKAVEYVNKTPQGTGFNRALIGVIEKNERIRKEMERIKQLLKE